MRDDTPETEVSELLHWRGSHAPALSFAQRSGRITEASPHAKGLPAGLDNWRQKAETECSCRLQRVEECEQPVPRLVAATLLSIERLDPGQRRLLQCKMGVQVDLGGLDRLMTKP